jgi:hypothetical protein
MPIKRRGKDERGISQGSEYEHYSKLADFGGHSHKADTEKGTEMDFLSSLGACGNSAHVSLFI